MIIMDFKNKSNIVISGNEQSVFLALDELDNKQISDEVKGVYSDDLVYQMKRKGPDGQQIIITSLSYAGVKAVTMFMARKGYRITAEKAEIIETPEEFRASCKVTCQFDKGSVEMFGYSRQQKNFSTGTVNEFAYIQAGSKSQRNALRTIIPEKIATEMIKQYLTEKKFKIVNEGQNGENVHNNHPDQNPGYTSSGSSPPANPQTKLIWKDGKAQGK